MTDRKKLEAVIGKGYAHLAGIRDPLTGDEAQLLLSAAQAHLASLPKPMWKVRVRRNCVEEVRKWPTMDEALLDMGTFVRLGHPKVEIEAP